MICIRSNKEKELNNFYKSKGYSCGYNTRCKECIKNKVEKTIIIDHKKCTKCKILKHNNDFPRYKKGINGRYSYCRKCSSDLKKGNPIHKAAQKAWRLKNKVKHRLDVRFLSYKKLNINITKQEFHDLLNSQANKCMICGNEGTEKSSLCLDHCHTTSKVRGFLCHSCNRGLGFFKDNSNNLLKAAEYLLKNKL